MLPKGLLFIVCFAGVFINACQPKANTENGLVATVFNKSLSLDDLEKLFPKSMIENDSLKVVHSFIDRWVKDQLILYQAERELSDQIEIDQLVEKYKSSLILLQYENKIIEENLDTLIVEQELLEYYEANKDQYVLANPIIKGFLIKIPVDDSSESITKDLKKLKPVDLSNWCKRNSNYCMIKPNSWYFISDIVGLLPSSFTKSGSMKEGTTYEEEFNDLKYILQIEEYFDKNEVPPYSYVVQQAKQVLLHQRRQNLLNQYKNEVYNSYKNNPNVSIY